MCPNLPFTLCHGCPAAIAALALPAARQTHSLAAARALKVHICCPNTHADTHSRTQLVRHTPAAARAHKPPTTATAGSFVIVVSCVFISVFVAGVRVLRAVRVWRGTSRHKATQLDAVNTTHTRAHIHAYTFWPSADTFTSHGGSCCSSGSFLRNGTCTPCSTCSTGTFTVVRVLFGPVCSMQ